MIQLPGLIDPHVHLRDPGATHKEDFNSGTKAALAGGFTVVLTMPNTSPPLTDPASLELAEQAGAARARCDYGIFLGAGVGNTGQAFRLAGRTCGLKLYLDQTYGPLRIESLEQMEAHLNAWPKSKPIAAHAERRSLAALLLLAGLQDRSVHICHVSRREEILLIRKAKEQGFRVTCEVTPHHLTLTEDDLPRLGPGRGEVRPRLATRRDREALWENMDVIDVIATDHAPHTLAEKDGENPPPGFPGLETSLAIMLTAVSEGRMTLEALIERMHTNPARIFGVPAQPDTYILIDPDARWTVQAAGLFSRCGWTPFEGLQLRGRVREVRLRGETAYSDRQVLSSQGKGRNLFNPVET
jgi:carbamoyl-phosphate synthase/aspartate carbamoyltransferase/dihydroorotase